MGMLDSHVFAEPAELPAEEVGEGVRADVFDRESLDTEISSLPAVPRRLLTALLHTFEPGRPISLYEAQMALRDDYLHAEATLAALIDEGELDRPSDGLWVRIGPAPNPYLLGARVTYPYTFVRETAFALHRDVRELPAEILICSPDGFSDFEYADVRYRSVGEWFDDGVSRTLVGDDPIASWVGTGLGLLSSYEPVAVTTLERTLVDCMRDPVGSTDTAEMIASIEKPPFIEPCGILRALDHTDDPQLPGRVAALLEMLGVAERQPDLMRAVRSRSGVIGRRRSWDVGTA